MANNRHTLLSFIHSVDIFESDYVLLGLIVNRTAAAHQVGWVELGGIW